MGTPTAEKWTGKELTTHFFFHIPRAGPEDLLWPLGSDQEPKLIVLSDAVKVFRTALRLTSQAATTPFYVALAAANTQRNRIVLDLMEQGRNGNQAAFTKGMQVLTEGAKAVDSSVETFREIKGRKFLEAEFSALYLQSAAMVWGVLESFLSDCSTVLFQRKPALGQQLMSRHPKLWRRDPAEPPSWTPSLEKLRTIADLIDPSGELAKKTDTATLRLLEARRHVIMHNAGAADRRYLDRTKETIQEGMRIVVGPQDLETYFRAAIAAGLAYAQAVGTVV